MKDQQTQYWPAKESGYSTGYRMEAHARLAADLLKRFVNSDWTPEKAVQRVFTVADAFFAEAEKRGAILQDGFTDEQWMKYFGDLDRIRTTAGNPLNDLLRKMDTISSEMDTHADLELKKA